MFKELEKINSRPKPFEFYTASDLLTDEHTSKQMLAFHLNEDIDVSSRNAAFIDRSVEWIATEFNVRAGFKIADFGCGPGLYATRLARKGADVTGIDFSGRSIQYAKQVAEREGLAICYENKDYLTYETGDRFDLIIMIMCDFCALGPVQRKTMLEKFHRFLSPGGHVLLDVYSLNAFEQRTEAAAYEVNLLNGFWSPEKYYGFLNTFKYDEKKIVLDKYTIVEETRTRTVYNWLKYFSSFSLEREFVSNGFAIERFYANVTGSPYDPGTDEFAIVAKRL
ncbi:MAG: class I SAM-dependent methyltransferase [Anaerolineales bacterium]|nr:class I SAM-dependent methyltransferase [Anaerolineales bacterium]